MATSRSQRPVQENPESLAAVENATLLPSPTACSFVQLILDQCIVPRQAANRRSIGASERGVVSEEPLWEPLHRLTMELGLLVCWLRELMRARLADAPLTMQRIARVTRLPTRLARAWKCLPSRGSPRRDLVAPRTKTSQDSPQIPPYGALTQLHQGPSPAASMDLPASLPGAMVPGPALCKGNG